MTGARPAITMPILVNEPVARFCNDSINANLSSTRFFSCLTGDGFSCFCGVWSMSIRGKAVISVAPALSSLSIMGLMSDIWMPLTEV